MSCYSVHAIRRRVVHLSPQPHLTFSTHVRSRIAKIAELPATFLRRRNPRLPTCIRTKAGIAHLHRLEDVRLRRLIQPHTAHASNDCSQRDESGVAVSDARSGRIAQWFRNQSLDRFSVSGPAFAQIEI